MALSNNTTAVDSATKILELSHADVFRGKGNAKNLSDSKKIRRRDSYSSPKKANFLVSGVAARNPSDTIKKMSSVGMSSRTNLTMATTRSSGSYGRKESTNAASANNNKRDRDDSSFRNTKQVSKDLVESKSSTSYPSVIRNWGIKYDTEAKDNYDSDSEYEEIQGDQSNSETREDMEEGHRRKDSSRNIKNIDERSKESELEEDNTWGCRVPNFLDNTKTRVKPKPRDGKSQTNSYDKDDDSDTAWFLNNSHENDKYGNEAKHTNRSTRMGGNRTSSEPDRKNKTIDSAVRESMMAELDPLIFELDNLSSEDKGEQEEIVFQEHTCDEDDWVQDGSSRYESEEIVVTYHSRDEFAEITESNNALREEPYDKVTDAIDAIASLCLTPRCENHLENLLLEQDSEREEISSSEDEDQSNVIRGEESRYKVTDAIDAIASLYATPRSQNHLPEHDSKSEEISSSEDEDLSKGDPDIEVKLHRNENNEEVDKIIVLNAVARNLKKHKTLTKSKENAYRKSRGEQKRRKVTNNDEFNVATNLCYPFKVSTDAMDILMSLNLMECCDMNQHTLPDERIIKQKKLSSDLKLSGKDNVSMEVSNMELAESNSSMGDSHEYLSYCDSKWRKFRDEDQSSYGCTDGIAVTRSACLGEKEKFENVEDVDDNDRTENSAASEVREEAKALNHTQDKEDEGLVTSLIDHRIVEGNAKTGRGTQCAKQIRDEPEIEGTRGKEGPSIIYDGTCDGNKIDCDLDPKSSQNLSPDFQMGHIGIENLDLTIDSDSFSIDAPSFSNDDPIRIEATPMVKYEIPKATQHKLPMTSHGNYRTNQNTYEGLATTMPSSFDLVTSISDSEECRIPSPPIRSTCEPPFNNKQKQQQLSYDFLSLQSDGIPPKTFETQASFPLPLSPVFKKKTGKRKKKKPSTRLHYLRARSAVDVSMLRSPEQVSGTIKGPLFDLAATEDKRDKKVLPNLVINTMVQNVTEPAPSFDKAKGKSRKYPASSTKTKGKSPKVESLHLDLGKIAKDSLRLERKVFSLPSPKRKFRLDQNSNIFREDRQDQENCFPHPCETPKHEYIKESSVKGILRGRHRVIPRSSKSRRRVRWDEEQLANKVEKGIMALPSPRIRPIRKLERLMRHIVVVQNGYGKKPNPGIAQGYIC